MTRWDELREQYKQPPVGMTRTKILEQIWIEGDKLQRTIATGYCGECDIHKEKLEAIRPLLKEIQQASPSPKIHYEYLIQRGRWYKLWDVLGATSIKSDTKRIK